MIKINLLGSPAQKHGKGATMPVMPSDGTSPLFAVLIVLVIFGLGNGIVYYVIDKQGKEIQQQIAQADAEQKRLAQVKAAYLEKQRQADLYKRRVDVIDQLRANQAGPANLLASLGDTVNGTEAVWLSKMTDSGAAIDLTGTALSNNAVANLMANLKKTGLFKNVELKETVQDAGVKDYQAFNFTLTCEKGKS
ncbi:Fimbrial assembly protein [Candidatus Koribacter versatilis Ellin345]|uniref:Fimbrial assembly protein n=1 Tax=Koribacter versatilis (strain Ellin345) TaxID=204669 RepID=Q1IRM8_KORVE|nr:PilN domain-containing protein [Candidatus Koribacter versatilis]ABF40472.1 Fimbrial assembly protein [Candidatus Koribacter versatilis Ellin345]